MSENMEKKTNNIRFAVGFLAFGLLWSTGLYVVATVLRIQKVKVYIEGNNLCTWSGLPEGVDPEWPGVTNGYYPQQRTVVGGLEVSF